MSLFDKNFLIRRWLRSLVFIVVIPSLIVVPSLRHLIVNARDVVLIGACVVISLVRGIAAPQLHGLGQAPSPSSIGGRVVATVRAEPQLPLLDVLAPVEELLVDAGALPCLNFLGKICFSFKVCMVERK